jgi:F-type H+-transporting ATPase subunit delta
MAELATIARPYAEALFEAAGRAEPRSLADPLDALAQVATLPALRRFADRPNIARATVFDVIAGALEPAALAPPLHNLLRTVIEGGRLEAMTEIAAQYRALVNAASGVSDATIYSAFPVDGSLLPAVVAALERRFCRRLDANVVVEPDLIAGIRVVVDDEVLDASVKAQLQQ